MGKVIKMDLYRIRKERAFWVYIIIAFLSGVVLTPAAKLGAILLGSWAGEASKFETVINLSEILKNPFPLLNAMLIMLSANTFFYSDVESGYIKNTAGQMSRKSYSIFSKFTAVIFHNILFILVGILGNVLGTLPFRHIVFDSAVLGACGTVLLKVLLLQSLCSVLLLTTAVFRNKALGSVLSVLFGMGLLYLVYIGIDSGLDRLFPKKNFAISDYMPDQLLTSDDPEVVVSIVVSLVTIVIFLGLSMFIFDRKDVK